MSKPPVTIIPICYVGYPVCFKQPPIYFTMYIQPTFEQCIILCKQCEISFLLFITTNTHWALK